MAMITAQDLYNYTKCRYRVYLDAHGDPSERAEVSAFIQLLWDMGLQAEREYMDALGDTPYADLQVLSVDDACVHTAELMSNGADVIYQGGIRAGEWIGRPDLLVKRTDADSRFGN